MSKMSRIEIEAAAMVSNEPMLGGLGELERLEQVRDELKGGADVELGLAIVESVLMGIGVLRGFLALDQGLDTPADIKERIDQMLARAGSRRIDSTLSTERWFSGSKVRRVSISSSNRSMR